MSPAKLNDAPKIEDDRKLNPHILRQLIFTIIEKEFDYDYQKAALSFNERAHRTGKTRHKTGFDKGTLYKIVTDRSFIKYYHLEAISNYLGVPVFVILLFTRILSSNRDKNQEDIENIKIMLDIMKDYTQKKDFKREDIFEISNLMAKDKLFRYYEK